MLKTYLSKVTCKVAATVAIGFLIVACASQRSVVGDLDRSVKEIRRAIQESMPGGERAVSPNGREFLSHHFTVRKDKYEVTTDASDRYYAKFLILGDRRPYSVQIVVVHERRVLRGEEVTYVQVGNSLPLAKDLDRKFRRALTQGREDSNIIDDFRVF